MQPEVGLIPHAPVCGARNRAGAKHPTCQRVAGWGTDHHGDGRCKYHGGATPVKHGAYSKIRRTRLGELAEEHLRNPDPLNLFSELAYGRAMFEDWVDRYTEWRTLTLAWWQSWSVTRRPAV
jgi:hypothetical protein